MINLTKQFEIIQASPIATWLDTLTPKVDEVLSGRRWGDMPKWQDAVLQLPEITPSIINLNSDAIVIGCKDDCDRLTRGKIEERLRQLHPWRKGPFDIFGIFIDTEWRSDLKWNRLKDYIQPLENRLVLDIGCGSGYHCLRMAGCGANLIIGIDPIPLYVMQFFAFQKYINNPSVNVFPVGIDDLPEELSGFDTVFSMGLLYHRRSPFDHLLKLRSLLREGGEIVLETLVIDGKAGDVLAPEGRYALMPNVWFIPTMLALESWLKRMGFLDIRLIDVTKTTSQEQRVTDWMGFQSLADFLDKSDPNKTVEGYPAPQRAIFLATNP